jgi:hypothetical protein
LHQAGDSLCISGYFVSEHLDIFLKKSFIKTIKVKHSLGCVGYMFPYPGIIARPVSGSPSSAFSPAQSVGMHFNIQNNRK